MSSRSIASVLLFTMFAATNALALCYIPSDPGLVCGLGLTAIRGTVQATDGDVLTVLIDDVAGQALDGIEVGAEAVIAPDAPEFPDSILPPASGPAIFILRDSRTFMLGARVDENSRVPITGTGNETIPIEYVLAIAVDEDIERCRNVAFEVVEPRVARNPGCNDEVGCSSVSSKGLPPLALLFLVLSRGRVRGKPIRQ